MNCNECRDNLAACVEGFLDDETRLRMEEHLGRCPACRNELADCQGLHEQLISRSGTLQRVALEDRVMNEVQTRRNIQSRRSTMFKRYARATIGFAAAAAAILAAVLVLRGVPAHQASAAEIFTQAIQAVSHLQTMHMKFNVRTLPHDNFAYIGLDLDFVPHEIWKQFGETARWRAEKPGRTVVMDGTQTLCLMKPNYAFKFGPSSGAIEWLSCLLFPDKLLDMQLQSAQKNGWPLEMTHKAGEDGTDKTVVAVEVKAEGDYANDYLKNKSITDADTRRIYRFDTTTKLLENLQVYIHTPSKDVLVLEVSQIEYNKEIDPALFTLQLPDDVSWLEQPQTLPDNQKYEKMTPEETARAYFQAMSEGHWDELKKIGGMSFPPQLQEYVSGLQIISIGKPFKSGLYPGWFVPYEIRFKDGTVKKHNLAVRNDNPAKRYVMDGGF